MSIVGITLEAAIDALIAQLAYAQHGVVARIQLLALGLGAGAIDHRLRCGRLHRVHRGVYAVGHTRISREGRYMAAVLALGKGAALSHVSAAALWELRASTATRIHVTVPTTGGRRRRETIVVHRSGTLRGPDVERRAGIPVTSVARTLLDLASILPRGPLERAVEQSLVLRHFDLDAVRAQIDADRTRPGAALLAGIVATVDDEPRLTRSRLEDLMRELCAARGLPDPETNVVVAGFEVDFAWRRQRLVVETDGHAVHGTRIAFERDRVRDAKLAVAGWLVVRVTHRRLTREPRQVADELAALLTTADRRRRSQ